MQQYLEYRFALDVVGVWRQARCVPAAEEQESWLDLMPGRTAAEVSALVAGLVAVVVVVVVDAGSGFSPDAAAAGGIAVELQPWLDFAVVGIAERLMESEEAGTAQEIHRSCLIDFVTMVHHLRSLVGHMQLREGHSDHGRCFAAVGVAIEQVLLEQVS